MRQAPDLSHNPVVQSAIGRQETWHYAEDILETSREPLLMLDEEYRVVIAKYQCTLAHRRRVVLRIFLYMQSLTTS